MGAQNWVAIVLNLLLQVSVVNGKMATTVWTKVSTNYDGMGNVSCTTTVEEIRSVTDCGSTCSRHEGCVSFCFLDVSSSCYVIGTTTSSECQVHADVDTDCFCECFFPPPWTDDIKGKGGGVHSKVTKQTQIANTFFLEGMGGGERELFVVWWQKGVQ